MPEHAHTRVTRKQYHTWKMNFRVLLRLFIRRKRPSLFGALVLYILFRVPSLFGPAATVAGTMTIATVTATPTPSGPCQVEVTLRLISHLIKLDNVR